jgi:Na+/H+ antiporter NhaD/arsenite permease-like protein
MSVATIESHPALLAPFGILLASIAIFPLVLQHHWERHYAKLCASLAAITCGYYIVRLQASDRVIHAMAEFGSFIVVIGAFFVVAGGIHLHIPRPSSPLTNVFLLLGGSVLAALIGTIGASMLLIRPWLHMNRSRFQPMHLAFFIFAVGNLGGLLLPTGPPLFLGHLKGIPFLWTALHCWREWLTATTALLVIFVVLDTIAWRRHAQTPPVGEAHLLFHGKWNSAVLLALLLAVVFVPRGLRELVLIALAGGSYYLTPHRIFEANGFGWQPLIEVGWIFLGIFGTMIPVLDYVELHAENFHLATNAEFYWSTGILSGVLDNAPTYLTFLALALSLDHFDINNAGDVALFAMSQPQRLAAISVAATLFGGLTYIGNSPNLLVRAIAQSRDSPCLGFLSYIVKYALPILLPVLGLTALVSFRH